MNTIYIKLKQSCKVEKKEVYVEDVAWILCLDKEVERQCKKIQVYTLEGKKNERKVVSILKIIGEIKTIFSDCELESFGQDDVVVLYVKEQKQNKIIEFLKTAFVCLMSFIGAAFAIMTFNNDGDVSNVFDSLTFVMTGVKPEGMSIMKVSYMVGLPVGILVFFNHFSKAKVSEDPTPIEVQMKLYQDDICKTLVANEGEKKE